MKKILIIIMCLIIPITYAEEVIYDKEVTNESDNTVIETEEQTTNTPKEEISEEGSLNLAPNAKSAIMLEASTGKIIYEKNDKMYLFEF